MTKAMGKEVFPDRNTWRGHRDTTAVKIRSWGRGRGRWTHPTLDIMLLQ